MIPRLLKPHDEQSFFLLGPRGTGKTTLLQAAFHGRRTLQFDLLDQSDFLALSRNPDEIWARASALPEKPSWVLIDEVQKLPEILDTVQKLIDREHLQFALTGSSARKLKRAGSNLLAGRAVVYQLYPLTYLELGDRFDLRNHLSWGGLPLVVNAKSDAQRARILRAYAQTYLREEIAQERLVRALGPFQRFLDVAAQMSGQPVNYSAIATDCGISDQTVRDYFSILEDTLVGTMLPAYDRSARKQALLSPKFYFFDSGVERALKNDLQGSLPNDQQLLGRYFEAFLVNQIKSLSAYFERDYKLYHYRTSGGVECDLVIERPGKKTVALEIKLTEQITQDHLAGLARAGKALPECELVCVSQDPHAKKMDGIRALPWREAIAELMAL